MQVLSDFDDTISCSGAQPKFAGCDSRLPKGTLYPGAFSLFYELDKCFQEKMRSHELGHNHVRLSLSKPLQFQRTDLFRRDFFQFQISFGIHSVCETTAV